MMEPFNLEDIPKVYYGKICWQTYKPIIVNLDSFNKIVSDMEGKKRKKERKKGSLQFLDLDNCNQEILF